MRPGREAILILLTLSAVAGVTVVRTLPPRPVAADAPAGAFSAERASAHILVLAQQPRPTGSAANAAARDYILAMLKDLGLDTDTQRDGDLVNVLGRIEGARSSDAVLLTAHLDSVPGSPGATDDGSGVAVLLETARALQASGPLPNTVMFLFSDFEEGGLVGAKAFIGRHPWARQVRLVVGFDAGGLSGPGVLSTTSPGNGWLVWHLARADRTLTGSSAVNAFADSGTDFGHAFKPAGFHGYAFDLYWDRRIHTPDDSLANVSLSSLQHQGYHALSLARHFGQLSPLADPGAPDAVFFNVLQLFTVTYPSTWAAPLAIAVTAALLATLASGLRRGMLTWGGMGFGVFSLLVGMMIAPVPSFLASPWSRGLPFRYVGRALDRPPQVGAVVLAALILTGLWYAQACRLRRTSLPDLAMGALVLLWAGMAVTSTAFPALSFALTWPSLLSLLACANWFHWQARQEHSKAVVLGLLLAGAANIIIMAPTILLGLFDQMTLALLLLGALCGYLAPLIHLMLGDSLRSQPPAGA